MHHASLLIGGAEEGELYVRSLYASLGIELANNPDFFVFKKETFGIDEARELKLLSARKALTNRKIFLIVPTRITLEAQNALLKTFEEPFPDTYFFLVTREESLIVPTLLSRMQIVRISGHKILGSKDAEVFLASSVKDRLLFAKTFADEEKSLPIFLDNLLLLLRQRVGKNGPVESVYRIRRLVRDPVLAPRLTIEHLSLVL
ncbi:MAG: hypothetical protein Q7R69_03455 [bacterium]|nr:hypothetical protein [bacterium]